MPSVGGLVQIDPGRDALAVGHEKAGENQTARGERGRLASSSAVAATSPSLAIRFRDVRAWSFFPIGPEVIRRGNGDQTSLGLLVGLCSSVDAKE